MGPVGDGHGEGVGGIGGAGHVGEAELEAHHLGDLVLAAVTVPGDGALYEVGGVLVHLKAGIGEGEDGGGAGVTEGEGRARVGADERRLDGAHLR